MKNPSATQSFLFLTASLLTCLSYLTLTFFSYQKTHLPLFLFFSCMAISWVLLLLLRSRLAQSITTKQILYWGILFRVIALFGDPILEDDYYRYLWDGYIFATTGNPYWPAPAEYFVSQEVPPIFISILDGINNPGLPTIYQPLTQIVFLFSYIIVPGSLLPLKIILFIADLIIFFILQKRISLSGLLLYFWCPLLIHEIYFNAHPDLLGACFLIYALYGAQSAQHLRKGISFACALMIKPFLIFLAPFILQRDLRRILSCLLVLAICYLPFLNMPGAAGIPVLILFAESWEFNSSLVALLNFIIEGSSGRLIAGILFLGYLAYHFYLAVSTSFQKSVRYDLIIGAYFLTSAVVNPWYLVFLLPFVALKESNWGILSLALVSLSYMHGLFLLDEDLLPYQHPSYLRWMEYGPILILLFFSVVARKKE